MCGGGGNGLLRCGEGDEVTTTVLLGNWMKCKGTSTVYVWHSSRVRLILCCSTSTYLGGHCWQLVTPCDRLCTPRTHTCTYQDCMPRHAAFRGYMLCQIPGGYYTSALGGRRVLPAGVGLWSAATAAAPIAAATIPGKSAPHPDPNLRRRSAFGASARVHRVHK